MFSVRVIYNIFRRVDRQFINYIPAFVNTRECPCRTDLGTIEPLDYSFNYSIDENFPVIDLDTNTTSIEKHYICEAPRIAETIKFLHKPPFVVVDVGRHSSSMAELPDPLFIGNYNGNHCVCLDSKRPDRSQKLLNNMIYLQDQVIDIEGVRIYGSPWKPKRGCFYRAEAFSYDSQDIRGDKWSNIPTDIDILLTHVPPYSIRDSYSGCPGLLDEVVTRVRPRIHLFGHMHKFYGASLYKSENNQIIEGDKFKSESNDILFVNLAIHQGRKLNEAVVIDYYY
ncbi:unnamed protein product [Adineta steineri]|uniref:Calcineurin-like phosphoesterase domain-containing protein n=1 Tax=Adineta steineri TaxID=433720 RepID=A0A814MH05_9BILA|nr:unnamed protein product [Adineta steineri]